MIPSLLSRVLDCHINALFAFPCVFSDHVEQKGYSSLLSFTVTDINSTVTKLMALGAEMDGPIKYEVHGKVIPEAVKYRFLESHFILGSKHVWQFLFILFYFKA